MLGWFNVLSSLISRKAVRGIPSFSPPVLIFFIATVRPVALCTALSVVRDGQTFVSSECVSAESVREKEKAPPRTNDAVCPLSKDAGAIVFLDARGASDHLARKLSSMTKNGMLCCLVLCCVVLCCVVLCCVVLCCVVLCCVVLCCDQMMDHFFMLLSELVADLRSGRVKKVLDAVECDPTVLARSIVSRSLSRSDKTKSERERDEEQGRS